MQHEVLAVFALERIDDLLVLAGAQRRHNQGLGLAAGEQGAAVQARQDSDLGPDRAHGPGVAAVDALAGVENALPRTMSLLQLLESAGRAGTVSSSSSQSASASCAPALAWATFSTRAC